MFIYQITLAQAEDAAEFVTFMQDDYFQAFDKGPTRVGQVTDLVLLQNEAAKNEFFWQVSGLMASGGARLDEAALIKDFAAYGAQVKRLGTYREVAAWHEADEG